MNSNMGGIIMGKIMSAKEASMLVKGGDTIAVGGFVGCNHPEELTVALEKRFLATGCPVSYTHLTLPTIA